MQEKPLKEILRDARRAKGWGVREFIGQLGVDISPAYITKIEVHGEIPSPEMLFKMAKVLGIDKELIKQKAYEVKIGYISEEYRKKLEKAVKEHSGLVKLSK